MKPSQVQLDNFTTNQQAYEYAEDLVLSVVKAIMKIDYLNTVQSLGGSMDKRRLAELHEAYLQYLTLKPSESRNRTRANSGDIPVRNETQKKSNSMFQKGLSSAMNMRLTQGINNIKMKQVRSLNETNELIKNKS